MHDCLRSDARRPIGVFCGRRDSFYYCGLFVCEVADRQEQVRALRRVLELRILRPDSSCASPSTATRKCGFIAMDGSSQHGSHGGSAAHTSDVGVQVRVGASAQLQELHHVARDENVSSTIFLANRQDKASNLYMQRL